MSRDKAKIPTRTLKKALRTALRRFYRDACADSTDFARFYARKMLEKIGCPDVAGIVRRWEKQGWLKIDARDEFNDASLCDEPAGEGEAAKVNFLLLKCYIQDTVGRDSAEILAAWDEFEAGECGCERRRCKA
ncbi:hypothetical protein ACFL35_15565 [Candidatus Riflebacteria bacterium]